MSRRRIAAFLVVVISGSLPGCAGSALTSDESGWCDEVDNFYTLVTDAAMSLGVMTYFDHFIDQRGFDLDGRSAVDIQDELPGQLIVEWNLQDDASESELRASYLASADGVAACSQAFEDANLGGSNPP